MFKKLHLKLTAYMGLVLVIFICFIGVGIYIFTKMVFNDGARELMHAEAIDVYLYRNTSFEMTLSSNKDLYNFLRKYMPIANDNKLETNYIAYDKNFNIAYSKENQKSIMATIKPLAINSYEKQKDSYTTKRIGKINYRIYTKYFDNDSDIKIIQVYQNTINEDIIWQFLKTVLHIFGFSGIIFMLGISYVFTEKALMPVKFAWIKQKEFVADASHELRTPLTVIQTNLDVVMSNEDGTFEDNEMWLDNAYSETRVMAKLIDQLLILAKADANEEKLDISDVCVSEIVENVFGSMETIAKKKGLEFRLNLEDNIFVKADYDKLRRLIVILVDNAIKYTFDGSVILSLYSDKNKKVFSVEDTGIGISEKELDRIFDRFYRTDKSRHREGGTGLGLSIAKWIADSHKFNLHVDSTLNKGSKFTLRM